MRSLDYSRKSPPVPPSERVCIECAETFTVADVLDEREVCGECEAVPPTTCSASDSVCHAKLGCHDDPRPHHCLLPDGHEGRHFCHICGLYWDKPNAELSGGE